MTDEQGTLKEGEVHPCSHDAILYVRKYICEHMDDILMLRESLASCAIDGNRTADVCGETLRRILENEPVSDRYLLGLAWFLKCGEKE